MAGLARALRAVEERVQSFQQLVPSWNLEARVQGAANAGGQDGFDCRREHHPGAPRCGGRKRGIDCNALGRSRGGFSTKIHVVTDMKGLPLHVTLTPGHRHEMCAANELIDHAQGRALLGDAGYDSDTLVRRIRHRGMKVVICCNPTRKRGRRHLDRRLYRRRYRIECLFHRLKRFRAIASRYDKTARNYLAMVELACAWSWLS